MSESRRTMNTDENRPDSGHAVPARSTRRVQHKPKIWILATAVIMAFGIALRPWLVGSPGPATSVPSRTLFGAYSAAAPPPFLLALNLDSSSAGLSVLSAANGR